MKTNNKLDFNSLLSGIFQSIRCACVWLCLLTIQSVLAPTDGAAIDRLYGLAVEGDLYEITLTPTFSYTHVRDQMVAEGNWQSLEYIVVGGVGKFYAAVQKIPTMPTSKARVFTLGLGSGDQELLGGPSNDTGYYNHHGMRWNGTSLYLSLSQGADILAESIGRLDLTTGKVITSSVLPVNNTGKSTSVRNLRGLAFNAGQLYATSSEQVTCSSYTVILNTSTGTWDPTCSGIPCWVMTNGPTCLASSVDFDDIFKAPGSSNLYGAANTGGNTIIYQLVLVASPPSVTMIPVGTLTGLTMTGFAIATDPVPPVCDQLDNLYLQNQTVTNTQAYQREGLIAAGNNVNPGGGTIGNYLINGSSADVIFTAGSRVLLAPGFIVSNGAKFRGLINPSIC